MMDTSKGAVIEKNVKVKLGYRNLFFGLSCRVVVVVF